MAPSTVRWTGAIGGCGFVALFIVAAILYANGAGRDPQEIVAYYSRQANRLAQIEGFAVLSIGLALFGLFVSSIRALLQPEEPWSSVILGAGFATLICLLIANTLWASSAFTSVIEANYVIDPRSHLLIEDTGFAFLVAGGVMGALFVGSTSFAMARAIWFPRWLAWSGVPVVIALLSVYWYLPLFAFFVWIVVVGVSGLVVRREAILAVAAESA